MSIEIQEEAGLDIVTRGTMIRCTSQTPVHPRHVPVHTVLHMNAGMLFHEMGA